MPTKAQPSQSQWLTISDFTAGIYSYSETTSTADRLNPAPPGAADAAGTYSCMGLPKGGLCALPGVTETYAWPLTSGTTTYLVGLLVHDELADGTTEAIIIGEYDNGTNHIWGAASYILETNTATSIVETTEASAAGIFGSPYPQLTRANLTLVNGVTVTAGSPTITIPSGSFITDGVQVGDIVTVAGSLTAIPYETTVIAVTDLSVTMSADAVTSSSPTDTIAFTDTTIPGNPVAVFPSGGPAQPTIDGALYMYPNPSTPTSYTPLDMVVPDVNITGQVVCHQNRIIVLTGITYGYPAGGGFETNEQICFTDPPNSAVLGFQQTVLAAEEPYGYGAWGSVSAGELFLIKKRDGALLVTGDIFAPNVTYLHGVQSTGGIYGRADSGVAGLFYCSVANGAWMWNGGSTSVKVSKQLDDNFFLPPEFYSMQSNNYGFYVQCIGDKVYFSNNWIFDTETQSWWKYYPDTTQGGVNLFWVQPVSGPYIYAARLSIEPSSSTTFLYRFDTGTPAQTYQWRSLPLKLATEDHVVDITRVIVHASCTAAYCQITVTIFDKGVEVWTYAQTGNVSDGPDILRFNAGAAAGSAGLTEPQIQVTVTNSVSGDMAIIHDLAFQYTVRAPQAANN